MSNTRYQVINTRISETWFPHCPANVDKWQLLKDNLSNHILLRVKHFNSSFKAIKTVYISIKCYDDTKDLLAEYNDVVSIQGKNIMPGSVFSDEDNPIIIDFVNTTGVEIVVDKVVFTDDSIWRNTGEVRPIDMSVREKLGLSSAGKEQLKLEYSQYYSKDSPLEFNYKNSDNYWICGCGQFNEVTKGKCSRCNTEKAWLEEHLDKNNLENNAQKRISEKIEADNFAKYQTATKLIEEVNESIALKKENVILLFKNMYKTNCALNLLKAIPDYRDSSDIMELFAKQSSLSNRRLLNALKNKITISVLGVFVLAIVIFVLTRECEHVNVIEKTCTQPSICEDCGEKFEDAIGHQYDDEPTCDKPVFCIHCGQPKSVLGEGKKDVLEHDLSGELTCTESAYCNRCKTIVPKLGHNPSEATCTEASVCSRCKEQIAEPLGHCPDMELCQRCGELVGKILFQDKHVTVYHTGTSWFGGSPGRKEKRIILDLVIENKSDSDFSIFSENEKINGKENRDFTFYEDIERESKIETYIEIEEFLEPFSAFGVLGVEDIKNISFNFCLDGYYYPFFRTPNIKITPQNIVALE